MSEQPMPRRVDMTTPNAARMYDYYLGGKDNFAADRDAASAVLAAVPQIRDAARVGRELLGSIVRHVVESGVRQIIDLGSGLPTQDNVHEIAHQIAPLTRVVYVDHDPVVVSHGQALLEEPDHVAMVQGDLTQPAQVLSNPQLRRLIDLDEPVALLMLFALHLVPDTAQPHDALDRYRSAIAPGSVLAVTHATADGQREQMARISQVYRGADSPFTPRSRAEILRFFGDFDLVLPGLVSMWPYATPPDDVDPALASMGWSAVGVKPS